MKNRRRCAPPFSCHPRKTAGGGGCSNTLPSRAKVNGITQITTLHACFCATRTAFFYSHLNRCFQAHNSCPTCPCPDSILRQLVSYRSCHLTIVFLFQACPVLSAEQLYQRRPQTPVCRLPPVLCACCASLYWCSCIFTAFARVPAWICIGS